MHCVGLIRLSLENTLSMANLCFPLFLTFFGSLTFTLFRQYCNIVLMK